MAKKQVRNRVAAAASGLAVTALLAGPALTWGLDTAGITSASAPVSSTVQTVTNTVQQTTSTAVSTVQNTVQTTTAPVVQTAAPVVQQVQSTVAPAPAAPTSSTPAPTQTSAPAKTVHSAPTRSASAPKTTSVRNVAASVHNTTAAVKAATRVASAVQAAASTTAAVKTAHAVVQRPLRATSPSTSSKPATARAALLPCDRLVALLPLGGTVQGLVTLLCDAGNLAFPARMGPTTNASPAPTPIATLVRVLGSAAANLTSLHARAAKAVRKPLLPVSHSVSDHTASLRGRQLIDGMHGTGAAAGRGSAAAAAAGSAAAGSAAGAVAASTAPAVDVPPVQPHQVAGGLFGTHFTGTDAVSLVLIVCLALLAALLMWGAARRWVLPHFA